MDLLDTFPDRPAPSTRLRPAALVCDPCVVATWDEHGPRLGSVVVVFHGDDAVSALVAMPACKSAA
jgi:hypothetical protein